MFVRNKFLYTAIESSCICPFKTPSLLEQDVHEGQAEPDGGDGEVEPGESRLHSALLQTYSGLCEDQCR